MKINNYPWLVSALLAVLGAPAYATVQITSFTPSVASPQLLGTPITWTATATDSNSNLLAFQFNVALPKQSLALVKDFNIGKLSSGIWTSLPFVWVPTHLEGTYQIQVVIKDFVSGETTSQTASFTINPLVTGSTPVVAATTNPLVALFSAPSCAAGSNMRVTFQEQSKAKPAVSTTFQVCHPPATMNFEIAGMYASTAYTMFSETDTSGTITKGPAVTFTTGAIPTSVPIPSYTFLTPAGAHTDTAEPLLLLGPVQFGAGPIYPAIATDLKGNPLWYYYTNPPQSIVLTRPLSNSTMLSIQSGIAWTPGVANQQYLRQFDLAGNTIKETNTGAIQQELLALGVTDGGPCSAISKPAPVGSACLDGFHHDAIETLPNGQIAVLVTIEKILPPGTQGDTSGLPVDVVGDMILVLNRNWQIVWYFDSFEHDSGAPQLDINRSPVLNETCVPTQQGCPGMFLMGTGIAPFGKDWLHGNALYYWPKDSWGGVSGDLTFSSRNQDWVMKIDYHNGTGTGNVLWRMGPCGDYTFNNIYNDPWPWNSAQHDVGIENNGAGPLTLFDNGATRVSPPNSSSGCMKGLGSGNSRGMALTLDETNLQVTPILSVDLGAFSTADGSAQLLSNGNYFYVPATVLVALNDVSYSIEILPTPGTDTGTQVFNVESADVYRAWRMSDLYHPPIT